MSRQQVVNELHKRVRKNFPRRKVKIKGIDDLWQADLVEMQAYSKINNGFKYLLTVVDAFSKYAWVKSIKNKTAKEVSDAISQIFQSSSRIPRNLQTDLGKEFYNTLFKNIMKKHNINHYSSYSFLKASIVERFNRTLKEKMWKMFSFRGSYKWRDILDNIVHEYNNSKHRTINMAPVDVNNKRVERKLLNKVFNYGPQVTMKCKYKIGDNVRISKFKKNFEKGYTPNWSPEIFKISHIYNKYPVTYLIEDYRGQPIAGRFYEYELQKVKNPNIYLVEKILQRKGNRIKVKWLGFDVSHASWIKKSDMV